jgi:DNA-binding response OmpR family regulator
MPVRTAPPLRGTETVLVAEDDAALRRLVTMVLDHYGYDVIEAVDGAHALEQYFLHRDRIRLAILDGIMPKKNGFDVFAEIRRADPDLAVIIVSGYAEGIFRKNDSGGDDFTYLRKPVLPRQLAEKVRNELDKRIAREKAEGER